MAPESRPDSSPPPAPAAADGVVPGAIVCASGEIEEVHDGRGRRMLEAEPPLVEYARALLALDLLNLRFIWVTGAREWWSVRVQRLPRAVEDNSAALVETLPVAPPHGLTLRELDVLTLLSGGLSNPEIAAHLGASTRTVSTHVERLLGKLGQVSRTGAAAIAVEHGLLRLPVPGGGRSCEALAIGLVHDVVAHGGRRTVARAYKAPQAVGRQRPYVIGSAFPLSGAASADGIEMRNGSALAIAEINARGGIAGRPVQQLVVDMEMTTMDGVVSALRRLVDAEVDAITTGYAFAEDLSAYADVSAYGCPLLNSMTSQAQADWVREERDRLGRVFQSGPTEIHYGGGFIRFLDTLCAAGAWRPPNRRVVFVETPVAGGHTTLPATIERAERSGWSVDALITVAAYGDDWSTTLAQIRRSAPAAVMVAHFVPAEMAAFQQQFVAEPTDTLVYGVYAPSVPEFLELAGSAAEGLVWSTVTGMYNDRIGGEFARRYAGAFGVRPGHSLAGVSYDQVNLLSTAWASVGNPRAFEAVAEELRRITHRGVNGTYFLGSDGQAALSYPDDTPDPSLGQAHLVLQVQGGRHRILDPLPYADGSFALPPWFATP
jgi:branched-chain amino acid transport system substrate-binding protein